MSLHRAMRRRHFLSLASSTAFVALAGTAQAASSKLRVGVIGHTGKGDYGHGVHTMWLTVPNVEVVAVADADPKGLQGAREKLGQAAGFADYRQMLGEVKPEIVAVAPRYVDEHAEMILAAIASGARGVYSEKPFCRTPAEADAICAAAEKAGTKVAIAHRNRWHPALLAAQKAVKDGAIGQLLEMRARGKEDTRGGALDLWVLGSHLMNLIHFFGGRPLACSASVLKGTRPVTREDIEPGAEGVGPIAGDQVHARYDMECGVPAYFDSIRSAGVREANFGLQLIGTKGLIDLRVDVEPLAHLVPGNPHQPTKDPRPWIPISSAGIGQPEPIADLGKLVAGHTLAGRDLVAAIEENRPPLCSAEDGRIIVEMISAVFASHAAGGARIPLPLVMREHPWSGAQAF